MTTPLNLRHNLYRAPTTIPDPGSGGTITVDKDGGVCPITTATAEARTLRTPTKAGIVATLVLYEDGGSLTLTVTGGYNADADTTITFTDAGDFVRFMSIDVGGTYYWRVIAQEGTNAAAEDMTVDQLTATTLSATTLSATTLTVPTVVYGAAVTAEHGAGAIGTGTAPATYRYTRDGDIITEIQIDLTGLASVATGDDVIGKTGAAYIGRNVVASNGIIYKMELICLETPAGAGADTDINVVANVSGALEKDGAGGTTYGVNGGAQAAGQVVANLVQGLTANHYLYLTAGTGSAGTYTAGQLIVRLYGHAVLA